MWNVRIKTFYIKALTYDYIYFWLRFIFVHNKSLNRIRMFQTGFENKFTFWNCVFVLWIYKGYFVVKNWYEMFLLKNLVMTSVISNKSYTNFIEERKFFYILQENWKILAENWILAFFFLAQSFMNRFWKNCINAKISKTLFCYILFV